MGDALLSYRMRIGLFVMPRKWRVRIKTLKVSKTTISMVIRATLAAMLITLGGDVELNPGPPKTQRQKTLTFEDLSLEREADIVNVDSGLQSEKDLRVHGEYASGSGSSGIQDVEVEVPEYIYRRSNPSDLKTECAKPFKKAEFDFYELCNYMALRKLRTIECENNNAKRQLRPDTTACTSRARAHSAGCDTGKNMQQLTIDPYSECMVRGIGQTQPQVSDFLAEDPTKPIVSLKDCGLQNSNGKCVKKGGKQPLKQSDSEQNSDRSFGQTRPQSHQDIGGASVEEEEGPLPSQSNVSQLNHRPQGLKDTKGLPEKYEENQPLLQETHNKANLQDDHNHPSEQLAQRMCSASEWLNWKTLSRRLKTKK